MKFNVSDDLKCIREVLKLSQLEIAKELGIEQITITRTESGKTYPNLENINKIYDFAYSNLIKLNKIKEMFYCEELKNNHKLLFHGAKNEINGNIDLSLSRYNNDFGRGFYCGENYGQSASFVSRFKDSSVYILDFDLTGLKSVEFNVNNEWMLCIAYFRGRLEKFKNSRLLNDILNRLNGIDYIIAPIADNRMFQIIDTFIDGEITDEQCKHCLAATNLGKQYVLVSDKAINNVKILERCFISNLEKKEYKEKRNDDLKLGDDKVKLARIQYRGKGRYIDEILNYEKN